MLIFKKLKNILFWYILSEKHFKNNYYNIFKHQ